MNLPDDLRTVVDDDLSTPNIDLDDLAARAIDRGQQLRRRHRYATVSKCVAAVAVVALPAAAVASLHLPGGGSSGEQPTPRNSSQHLTTQTSAQHMSPTKTSPQPFPPAQLRAIFLATLPTGAKATQITITTQTTSPSVETDLDAVVNAGSGPGEVDLVAVSAPYGKGVTQCHNDEDSTHNSCTVTSLGHGAKLMVHDAHYPGGLIRRTVAVEFANGTGRYADALNAPSKQSSSRLASPVLSAAQMRAMLLSSRWP